MTPMVEQYVEENERLRAILGEWSTRAAKVVSNNSLASVFENTFAYNIYNMIFAD